MKKLFSVLVIAGMAALVACGPSAEEIAAKAKATADSLKAIATADSLKTVATADSIAAAERQQFIDDSIANAAKPKGGKPAPTKPTKPNQPIPKEQVKAGQGKG